MAETLVMAGVKELGRETALHFVRQGWRGGCAARTAADVQAVAAEVQAAGGIGVPLTCDLLNPASLTPLSEIRPDLVVAAQTAAGRFGSKPLLEIDDEELARNLAAYVTGTWNLLKVAGRAQVPQGRGTFLQTGTSSRVRPTEPFAAIGAAQHALRALVQVAAKEWRPPGDAFAYLLT